MVRPLPLLANNSERLGHVAVATALVGFGVLQFVYGDFVPGRAPAWPAAIPGRLLWAYASGAILIACGAAIAVRRGARSAALLTGAMILAWALLRHVPGLLANPHGIVLTQTGKALALGGGAFAIAGSLPAIAWRFSGSVSRIVNSTDGFLNVGRVSLGTFMILGGIQHFIYPDVVATLIPVWIPAHQFWTYFAGTALIAGGAGLVLPPTARLAAALSGVMLLSWVFLLHIPRSVASDVAHRRSEWTAVFEALAMSGIAFVLAGRARARRR